MAKMDEDGNTVVVILVSNYTRPFFKAIILLSHCTVLPSNISPLVNQGVAH